ncbi:MAG: cofactor-independent phosphoglycerate mutase [Bacteroidales bacterium]|nr:cofactor-independent phosphoglycerate mutase [Bacteroidales bacterium]
MKHIIILGDGMADWPDAGLGGRTILQAAHTPYMDLLAAKGRCGMLKTVPDGFHPGSEVANSSILGYDQRKVYEGRGPLEAASIGVSLDGDDLAIRCNLVCVEGDMLKNHSCGRLETEEADVLIKCLNEQLGSDRIRFHTGVQYRNLLVVKGGDKRLVCTPPHDIPLHPWRPALIKAAVPEAQETADLLNGLILRSQEILVNHPLNLRRKAEGKDMASSIWPWAGGYRPAMEPLGCTFPQIGRGSVITAVDLIRGIGHYAGLKVLDVEGATGLWDTNYEGKAAAAIEALKHDDFVYVHVEAPDEAGHDGDIDVKLKTVEDLDARLIGPVYEALKEMDEPVAMAVLPDHPTPIRLRTHTSEPVPFLIWAPGIEPDSVKVYDEFSCREGSYGLIRESEFIREFMKI